MGKGSAIAHFLVLLHISVQEVLVVDRRSFIFDHFVLFIVGAFELSQRRRKNQPKNINFNFSAALALK